MSRQIISVTENPKEKGSAIVTVSPVDEDGAALLFAEVTNPQWQLMKVDGTVVNDRTFTNSSLSSFSWSISGDDLAFFDSGDNGWRVIAFKATYTSTLGSDLPLIAEGEFEIDALLSVADEET